MPVEVLRQQKIGSNKEIFPITTTYNPNNHKHLSNNKILNFRKFMYSKRTLNIFQKKKTVYFISQTAHAGRLLCRSKFES